MPLLLLLAEEVHRQGYKVALTGEGADEWLAGYPWYKIHKLLGFFDLIPGLPLSPQVRRAYLRLSGAPRFPWSTVRHIQEAAGGTNAWLEVYGLMSLSRPRFYSTQMRETLAGYTAYEDLDLNLERMRRWHPLNRSIYLGARVHLPGLLLNAKGDRVAMHSSVETRYPFLDEAVFDYLAQLHPRWKLHGFRDKLLLRRLAERWLPPQIAWRRKAMFRAPFDSFHGDNQPAFVEQLLSEDSLRKTGYFDPKSVRIWRRRFPRATAGIEPADRPGDGAGRRGLDAALAPSVHRKQPGRSAEPGRGRDQEASPPSSTRESPFRGCVSVKNRNRKGRYHAVLSGHLVV